MNKPLGPAFSQGTIFLKLCTVNVTSLPFVITSSSQSKIAESIAAIFLTEAVAEQNSPDLAALIDSVWLTSGGPLFAELILSKNRVG